MINNVIGPFDHADWILLGTLKESMRYSKEKNRRIAYKKEKEIYEETLHPYLNGDKQ